ATGGARRPRRRRCGHRRAPSRGSPPRCGSRRPSCLDGVAPTDETELGDVLELADVTSHLEEGVEPGPFARPERVAELLEVAREIPGGIAVALDPLEGEHVWLGPRQPNARHERALDLRDAGRNRLGCRPDGKD